MATTSTLDWDDLRFFLAVTRHRTLALAAKHLNVTQTTVGRRLTALQNGLGVRLLDRTANGYVPTMAGQSILAHIEKLEAEAHAVEQAITGLDTRLGGLVRVAGSQLITSHVLAPCFAAFQASHPDIVIEAVSQPSSATVGHGGADVLVQLHQFEDQNLVVRNIGTMAFGLYACLAYIARHGEPDIRGGCAGHRLITVLHDDECSEQETWLRENAGQAKVAFKADNYESRYWAAYCNGGLALLPRFRTDPEPAFKRVATSAPVPPATIWLGVRSSERSMPRVRAVLDSIAEAVRLRAADLNPDE